jgi:hypothetical protein
MSSANQSFIPLRALIDSLPGGTVSPRGGTGILDKIGISDFDIQDIPAAKRLNLGLAFADELGFEFPGVDGLGIYFGSDGATNQLTVQADIADDFSSFETRIVNAGVILRFPPSMFRSVQWTGSSYEVVKGPGGQPKPYEILLGGLTLAFDSDGDLTLSSGNAPPTIALSPLMIGETGIVIESDGIEFYLSKKVQAPGQAPGWRGLYIQSAKLHLPGDLADSVGVLQVSNAYIGNGGFTGSVSSTWPNGLVVNLFGLVFTLKQASVGFVQNALVESQIKGAITLPFFDKPLDVEIGIAADGGLSVGLGSASGLATLHVPGVLDLELDSLKFEVDAGVLTATISGKLIPKVPGLNWPTINLKDLKIDSKGNVKLPGGWLDLPSQCGLNLYGFKVSITKFGMGRNDDGTKWIGFSGSVKMVDGLPAGASVEGLRITAKDDWSSPKISFNGVGVELDAKAFYFKGAVAYREFLQNGATVHRFDGDLQLKLRSPKLEIDGNLVVGSVTKTLTTPAYNFFAIHVGVELPTGIPLGATGLALYGFAGLLAIEMEPDKKADEAWYAIDPARSWYKRPDIGVADLKKWINARGSKAFGAGVTLGVYAGNGYVFNGKVLLAIVFPGPIILLEGMANLLKDRDQLTKGDPLFRSLAVLDNRAGSLLIGLDVKYQYDKNAGKLIKIAAGTEAYYEFNNPTAWHIYLGIKEPREQRIQADILTLFKANAYLMLNAHQLAMGAWVGYDKSWNFGPLSVTLQAWMENNAVVSFKPAHLYADLWVHGAVDLKAFGFGLGLTLDARLAADVFDPFHVLGEFDVEFKLPWPFKKKHLGAHVQLEWGPRPGQPPVAAPLKDVAIEHFKASTKWPLPALSSATTLSVPTLLFPDYADANGFLPGSQPLGPDDNSAPPTDAPIVPLDCRPSLGFARNVNDDAQVGTIVRLFDPDSEQVGDPVRHEGPGRVRYGLEELRLEKWDGSTWQAVAGKGGNSGSLPELFGTWAPINGTSIDGMGQDKLLVWSKTGFDHIRHTGSEWADWFTGAYPDFPCLPASPVTRTCFDFEDFDSQTHYPSPLTHPKNAGMHFEAPQSPGAVNDFTVTTFPVPIAGKRKGLRQHFATGTLTIIFDQPVNDLRIVAGLIGRDVPFNVTVFDKNGTHFGPFRSVNNVADIGVGDVISAVLGLPDVGIYHLIEVCGDFGPVKKASMGVRIDNINILDPTLPAPTFAENFDRVTAPALPAGWTTAATGNELPWATSTTSSASAPNDAFFAPDANGIGNTESELITPIIAIRGPNGILTFQTLFNFESTMTPGVGLDGMVLEISQPNLNGGAFTDITDPAAGGAFLTGGYTHTISSDFGSPIAGRMAWSGLSGGTTAAPTYITTKVRLGASTNGLEIRLKWRVVTGNRSGAGSSSGGGAGNSGSAGAGNAAAQAASVRNHNRSSTAVWSARGNVLEPYANYRLRIVTTADLTSTAQGVANRSYVLPQLAYFQTKGPPGLSTLTKPAEPPQPADLVDASHATESKGVLDDLTLYVKQTIPPTVPKTGELPLLPRPVYRGYDVGVLFNEDYVDLMYRLAGRDLSLLLYDRNNQPVRDQSGRVVVSENPWGVNEQLSFNDQETPWIALLNDSPCVAPIDLESVPRDQTLQAAHAAQILEPDMLYEARLMPLLVHEDFSRIPTGNLGRWQVSDLVTTGAPSHWKVEEFVPKSYRVIQTSGIGVSGTWLGTLPTVKWLGTMLVLGYHPGLPATDSSQPPVWSDYRVSLYFRSSQDGAIGTAFRYANPNNFYLFTMDRPNGARRLIRVAGGGFTIVAEDQITYDLNRDYHLVIEAIGDSVRIYLDDALLFDVTDAAITSGGLALQCGSCSGAAFSDIQVHDFSKAAKSVYHFPFTSSTFVDFFHHLHSFDDECWPANFTLPDADLATLDARAASNQNSVISDDEARAFERLADNALGTSANQAAVRTEVTGIEGTDGGNRAAFLLRTPEPINWARTSVSWAFSGETVPSPLAPGPVKLVAASLGSQQPESENVTLLVREAVDLTGYRIEKRDLLTVAGTEPPPVNLDDPTSTWISIYEFGSESIIAPGTQIVINSGNPDNPSPALPRISQRFRATAGTPGDVLFTANAVDLRLVDSLGKVIHARRFLNGTTSYTAVGFHILRKADGTAFFLLPTGFPSAGFLPGSYRLTMDFRRDNTATDPESIILSAAGQTAPETVILDVPSSTVNLTTANA